MIAFLKGRLFIVQPESVVLDVNGVGYRVHVPAPVVHRLPPKGEEVILYTHMQVREDGVSLFGFDSEETLDLFRKLLNVNGVGPKGALGVLSSITPENFIAAIMHENVSMITKAPGIGKKIAQRIILELKDKVKVSEERVFTVHSDPGVTADAVEALVALGYNPAEAAQAVSKAGKEKGTDIPVPDLIKHSLRHLAGGI